MKIIKIVNMILLILIVIYNLPLGLIYLTYLLLTSLEKKTYLIDLISLLLILYFSIYHFNLEYIVNYPLMFKTFVINHEVWALLNYQFFSFGDLINNGGFSLLIIPLIIKNLLIFKTMHLHSKNYIEMTNFNSDTTLLGFNCGKGIFISDNELNQHCLVVGTTGSGKTTTILNFVESALSRKLPCIYLDGKGDFDLVDKLQKLAYKHNQVFRVFTLRPSSDLANLAFYNPLASGNATEWKNRIMSLFAEVQGKGQEHFSLIEQNYINFVANVLAKLNKKIDLRIFLAFLEQPELLQKVANEVDEVIAQKLAVLHNDKEISALVGDVIKQLEIFIYSDYGHLFNTTDQNNVINIKQSIINNELILFLFDASAYPEDTRKVAKMVISDINSSFAEFTEWKKCFCIFDEFASYASSNLAEAISLHRSNGMHAVIGSQSITTVKLKSFDTKRVAEELLACCNSYIIHKLNHSDDVNIFANIIGTKTAYAVTTNINSSNINSVSIKSEDQFKIKPQQIKDLITGTAIVYKKTSAAACPVIVKIKPVNLE